MKLLIFIGLLSMTACAYADDFAKLSNTKNLHSLSLNDAEKLWQEKNRDLKLANDQLKSAEADRLISMQKPNPQLSLNTGSITGNSIKSSDAIIRIDQTFERGNKRELRMQAADLRANASKMDFADQSRQGKIMVDQAYYDLLRTQEALKISQDNEEMSKESVKLASLRFKSGDVSKSELSRMEVELLRAQNEIEQTKNDLSIAQSNIAYLLGEENQSDNLVATDNWPQIEDIPTLSNSTVGLRPDVKSAEIRVQAAEASQNLANSLKTRDVTLGVQYERNGSNSPMHSVGVGISIPLMTGYEYQGEIAHADVDWQSAIDNLERTKALALTDIVTTRNSLITATNKLKNFDFSLLKKAKESLDASEFAYQHGALSLIDLLDARRIYKATLLDASNARADYAKALSAWKYAIGDHQ